MQPARIKDLLESITNVAVLLVAIGVLSALSWGYFVRKSSPSLQDGFQTGQILAEPLHVNYTGTARTLLIAMNTSCHFCTESIPFYNELIRSQQGRNPTIRIIALFPNGGNEVKQYVQQNKLQIEIATEVNFRTLNIDSTPTMILVNNHGKILDFWVGKLSPDSEQQISKSINSL